MTSDALPPWTRNLRIKNVVIRGGITAAPGVACGPVFNRPQRCGQAKIPGWSSACDGSVIAEVGASS